MNYSMTVCFEHGTDIAYAAPKCPACDHVERLKDDYEGQLTEVEDRIAELEGQLNEREN